MPKSRGVLEMSILWILAAISIVLISIFAYWSTIHIAKSTEIRQQTNDTPIPEAIKNNPTLLNPIFGVYVVVGLFSAIMIFYMWATTGY